MDCLSQEEEHKQWSGDRGNNKGLWVRRSRLSISTLQTTLWVVTLFACFLSLTFSSAKWQFHLLCVLQAFYVYHLLKLHDNLMGCLFAESPQQGLTLCLFLLSSGEGGLGVIFSWELDSEAGGVLQHTNLSRLFSRRPVHALP